jgi:hypothetical protein
MAGYHRLNLARSKVRYGTQAHPMPWRIDLGWFPRRMSHEGPPRYARKWKIHAQFDQLR